MDIFSNVLEGTRQYFMGVPKPVQGEGPGQAVWPASTQPTEEGAPAQSGAPTPTSRPPSAAAASPSTTPAIPLRPPSEPLEPEPHIIHKATVMREAAEKRREQSEPEDEEDAAGTLSPPSHIIHKPRSMPSPAPAPAAPCPSPARPPSAAPLPPPQCPEPPLEPTQYRQSVHRVQTPTARPPDHFAPGRPPDPYSVSRPPEQYMRYHYESAGPDARNSHGPSVASQPTPPPRHSPQTYARMSSSMPQHAVSRLREAAVHSPPAPRYTMLAAQPPLLPNDRVPPIHHPPTALPPRVNALEARPVQYSQTSHQRESSPYGRSPHYDRHPTLQHRKYDPQQAYPGYRPTPGTSQPAQPIQPSHREPLHHVPYKSVPVEAGFPPRPQDRAPALPSHPYPHDASRHLHEAARHHHEAARRQGYSLSKHTDTRNNYQYPTPSTSTMRFGPSTPNGHNTPNATVSVTQSSSQTSRTVHRPATTPKTANYEYQQSNNVQTSPARSAIKPGYPNQQARMTVSVTSIVNQMNQTKHKRESPLDLSVKTVKNSADSSTTQDDAVDSVTADSKAIPLQVHPSSSSRHMPSMLGGNESHKVDFAPDFNQYRERQVSHSYNNSSQPTSGAYPARYNGSYEAPRPVAEGQPIESRHHAYGDRSKYSIPTGRTEYVPRIDLTVNDDRRPDNRIRDDRHLIIEERKRPPGPIPNNIPEKIVRYETWSADSRIDRLSQSAQEQHELMKRPVYSYSSHKQFEAYQKEEKRVAANPYRDPPLPHINHRYPYPHDLPLRDRNDYNTHYHDRNSTVNNRHVIQNIPNHREISSHHLDHHGGVPADKRVLSILRNSLETKQAEPVKPPRQIPDLIVIDDVDDSVIEIIDDEGGARVATKSHHNNVIPNSDHHIQMPKAVDSLSHTDYTKTDSIEAKSKSPENDVAARIRTKAELKVLPPSQDNSMKADVILETGKLMPKSQKQHLFNRIRQDNLRLESVIKSEKEPDLVIAEVKTEPMNIDEIEKDAVIPFKTENILETLQQGPTETSIDTPEDDMDWASACDSFVEQLKTGVHKKKMQRKRFDIHDNDGKTNIVLKQEPIDTGQETEIPLKITCMAAEPAPSIVIKQEPVDEEEIQKPEQIIDEEETIANLKKNMEDKPVRINSPDKKINEVRKPHKIKLTNKSESRKDTPVYKKSPKKDKDDHRNMRKRSTLPISPENSKDEKKTSSTELKLHQKDKKKLLTGTTKLIKEKDKVVIKKSRLSGSTEKYKHKPASKVIKNKSLKKGNNSNIPVTEKIKEPKAIKKEIDAISSSSSPTKVTQSSEPTKTVIKEESESTDDDEPLIKSKLMKEKQLKFQLLKDLSEKSAYVKLEFFDVDLSKNNRISIDSLTSKDKDDNTDKVKLTRQTSKTKLKSTSNDDSIEENQVHSSSESDEELSVPRRLRQRKNTKTEDGKTSQSTSKSTTKSPLIKKQDNSSASSSSSTPLRKPGFGDGSDFHPGWEEELYKYKRSLRMPTKLIAIPRGRSGGPFAKGAGALFNRGSTSLPDLDPAPLSPAPSSVPSAATDDFFARRPDKLTLDSDLDSNSSCSAPNRLQYDSEASTSTVFSSTNMKSKRNSIVDVLMKKCGKNEHRRKGKDKEERMPKIIPKSTNLNELLPTPSLGLIKNPIKGSLSAKKEKLMEDIFYLGAFRKETVTAFRNAFINNTDGLIGATEEFAPVVLKSRTRTESRVLKQRATIKEVFGDERPASAPPLGRDDDNNESESQEPDEEEPTVEIKKEPDTKPKLKPKKISKEKFMRRSNSIRDGLRSTISLKRNDAKGRLMRLKKRNSLMKSLASKRMKDGIKKEKSENRSNEQDKSKEGSSLDGAEVSRKKRLKRLFGRRKFSSGFDYIRKKKKIIRREDSSSPKIRRVAVKPQPESEHDIHKEIKGWFINKSIGETHLHRAARLGYTDCVAFCLEKLAVDPSAKDNAGYTPLHLAASKGFVRIARILLQYGANVSAAAQGGIRPLHEACENSHVEVIRLLLSYGADPLLGTYAGQTPEELSEGATARFLRLYIADVQGKTIEPWRFPSPAVIIDYDEVGCEPLAGAPPASPPPPPDATVEMQVTEAPLPPFYSLRTAPGQPADGLWCLLQDVTNLLQIKSKDNLLKQIHCGSGSPKELLREIRTQEFLERAQCHQLLGAGEKVNVRASKVALIRVTDKLRQLLKIETVLVS